MQIDLSQNQESQLNELALKTGRGADELVREAIARLLAGSEWFNGQVQIGIDQIARGELIDEDEMDGHLARMLEIWPRRENLWVNSAFSRQAKSKGKPRTMANR